MIRSGDADFSEGAPGEVAPVRAAGIPCGWGSQRREQARWVRRLSRVEAQVRTVERLVAADADRGEIVIRIVGIMNSLRSMGAEASSRHVRHCVEHLVEHGPAAGAKVTNELAEAIRQLVRS